MRFSRNVYLLLLALALSTVVWVRAGSEYIPPPLPPDIPDFPDIPDLPLPPDPWDIPFTDPPDLPDPWDIPFPEDDPWDDPVGDFPLPDLDIQDPFPDTPSLFSGEELGYSAVPVPSSRTFPGDNALAPRAATNVLTKLMPYPLRLPFHPVHVQGRLPSLTRQQMCDPATATKLVIPESGADTVAFVDTCPFKVTGRVRVGPFPLAVAGIPGTNLALVAYAGPQNSSGAIAVLDIMNRVVTKTIPLNSPGGLATPNGIAVLPDGSRAYVTDHSCDPGSTIFAIDLTTFSVATTIPGYCFPAGIAATPDGSQVWVTSRGDSRVDIIDTLTNTDVFNFGVSQPTGIAFNPTGTRAYVADTGLNVIRVMDASKYAQVASIGVGNLPHALAVSPSGADLFVTNALSNSISWIDTLSNKVRRTFVLPAGKKHPLGITFLN
jgi:YVTN family beta-propeller protein